MSQFGMETATTGLGGSDRLRWSDDPEQKGQSLSGARSKTP